MQPKRLVKQYTLNAFIGPWLCDVTLQVLVSLLYGSCRPKLAALYLYSKTLFWAVSAAVDTRCITMCSCEMCMVETKTIGQFHCRISRS